MAHTSASGTDSGSPSGVSEAAVRNALSRVDDPEIGKPITELDMVESVRIDGNDVAVGIYLTIAACPMRNTIESNVRAVIEELDGVGEISVTMHTMSDEQRRALAQRLKADKSDPVIPFNEEGSTTRIFAVASGKGGVGKSSMTVNLATALQDKGLNVGILDADVYGHSIPGLMGSSEQGPTLVDEMILPPIAFGVRHISIGQFVEGNAPVVWRGPMLHRAVSQFLTDVYWSDLDVLFLDLPPGTGDVALSVAQLLPGAELLIVTTPQAAAAEVAERAGSISQQTNQTVAGVIENMSAMVMPDGTTLDVFGSGGGRQVADRLTEITGEDIPLLGSVPLDPQLRAHGDHGTPIALSEPDSPAGAAIHAIADKLMVRRESLAGKSLGLNVT